VQTAAELRHKASGLLKELVDGALSRNGYTRDSIRLSEPAVVSYIYGRNAFTPAWSDSMHWLPAGDSLYHFILEAKFFGLFPEDYHISEIRPIREKMETDTLFRDERKDAALWARADILLTDAFLRIVKDIKLGRLPNDSITLRRDSVLGPEYLHGQFDALKQSGNMTRIAERLEPAQLGYRELKKGIPSFLAQAENRVYTKVPSSKADPVLFKKLLQKRLFESGYLAFDSVAADSSQLAAAVKSYQKAKGIAVDGVAGETTLRMMNESDDEKFARIALSMDKFKLLPEKMPPAYVWVNAAGNYLEVVENGVVKLFSKVICGKARTRTPALNSAISMLITYPQWVPPPSIVRKEILPAVKKNPAYLAKKGFSLLDSKGEEVDPFSVDWSKYSKGVPYRIVQGSGDANALGIMKFHFDNKYSVYLHDTNQRYLFASPMRSLSHGCVRVQEWEKLAWYIIDNDSLGGRNTRARVDSVQSWLQKKQKRNISIKNKLPVFIRYITCEGRDGKIIFHDDPYGEDRRLIQTWFPGRINKGSAEQTAPLPGSVARGKESASNSVNIN